MTSTTHLSIDVAVATSLGSSESMSHDAAVSDAVRLVIASGRVAVSAMSAASVRISLVVEPSGATVSSASCGGRMPVGTLNVEEPTVGFSTRGAATTAPTHAWG